MIENRYEERNDEDQSVFVTTAVIEIATATRVPRVVLSDRVPCHECADGKCVLTQSSSGSLLTVQPGYEWDGVFVRQLDLNRPERMEATLHHDAIYEALRNLIIPPDKGLPPRHPIRPPWSDFIRAREWADRCFKEILRRDKAPHSVIYYEFVRELSGGAAWPRKHWPKRMALLKKLHGTL